MCSPFNKLIRHLFFFFSLFSFLGLLISIGGGRLDLERSNRHYGEWEGDELHQTGWSTLWSGGMWSHWQMNGFMKGYTPEQGLICADCSQVADDWLKKYGLRYLIRSHTVSFSFLQLSVFRWFILLLSKCPIQTLTVRPKRIWGHGPTFRKKVIHSIFCLQLREFWQSRSCSNTLAHACTPSYNQRHTQMSLELQYVLVWLRPGAVLFIFSYC